ncbi:iron complex outermembrane recepter protein [Hymenobacter gelipurpurascens]|uniref:Iron complex outermembrane recepter protein n=1 Tax=Hymenobacter gelipurpurascens TaxID=89968 RepID=A0A212UH18_9BACT|nr:TonB-dependent receptor [Hymenobacter gelipurpurascens]SNC77486.1 iron complex outermembrane recepter protein [Hymenobacter gelipurpurascens]
MKPSTTRLLPQAFAFWLLILLSAVSFTAQAQRGAIQGRVTTADGQPAASVSVGIQGSSRGADTDANGNYRIGGLAAGTYSLGVRLIGFGAQERDVIVTAGQTTTQDFQLSESQQQLKEVVVEGSRTNKFARKQSEYVSKMPLQNLENPQVYATVGKELLAEQLVFTADDATRNAPGLQRMWEATGRAGDGGSYYNSRGFILQSQLRNGIAGNVSSSTDAVNLEKLEVIKGPSATLFGSALTSYGGLINRVTKKAYDTFGGEATYAGGSFGFNRLSLDLNTPLDKQKKLLFRLNTAGSYERNFQNRGYQGYGKSLTIAPTLTYKPTERLTIHLDAELYNTQSVGKQIIFFYFPPASLGARRADELNLDYRQSYIGNGLTQNSRSSNYFAQVNYQLAPGFTSSTNVTHSRSYSNGFGPYFYLTPIADSITTGDRTRLGSTNFLSRADQSTDNSRANTTEIQQLFNGDFLLGTLRNRFVVGLDYLRINNDQNFFGSSFGAPVALGLGNQAYTDFNGTALGAQYAAGAPGFTYPVTTKINTYSAFVSDVLNLTDRLSVLAALRLDRYDNQGGLVGAAVEPYKQTTLSPKFGVVFQPVKDRVALFANYQNSFANRGSYLNTEGQTRNATPERANQVEAGVKLDAADGRISATVSYYDIRVQDILRSTPVAPTTPTANDGIPNAQTQNGTQLSKGVELSLIANPLQGFNIVGGFAYNDSKLTRSAADVDGYRPNTASSPYLANLWLSYRLSAGTLKGLGLGFGGNYASDNKIVNSASQGTFILPAYTVLNASVFYDFQRFRLSGKVDNLTNEHYWIGYTTMNPQKVRSFVGSVAYKF